MPEGRETGRASEQSPDMAEEWEIAHQMNDTYPGQGEWVPRRAIVRREEINPRTEIGIDADKVADYTEVFFTLPPVIVQRDTWILIDGNHRMLTEPPDVASVIRIIEVDVPDVDLRDAAFQANQAHGIQLTRRERADHLAYLLEQHGADWADADYGKACGLSPYTVRNHRLGKGMSRRPELASIRKGDTRGQDVPKSTSVDNNRAIRLLRFFDALLTVAEVTKQAEEAGFTAEDLHHLTPDEEQAFLTAVNWMRKFTAVMSDEEREAAMATWRSMSLAEMKAKNASFMRKLTSDLLFKKRAA